jgi:hypothetical protein
VIFMSPCHFTGRMLLSSSQPSNYELMRAVETHMILNASPRHDFGLMPVALNLDSVVMLVVPHLFTELSDSDAF